MTTMVLWVAMSGLCQAETTVFGIVQSVDTDKRRLTVLPDGPKKTAKEFDVSRKATIILDGKASDLGSLKSGHEVRIRINTELEVVTRVEASSPAGQGEIGATSRLRVAAV